MGGREAGSSEVDVPEASAPSEAASEEDGAACFILASNYDQSCAVDSDCIGTAGEFAVQFGNYCTKMCTCGGDAINKASASQYVADVSRTPLGSGALGQVVCSCGFEVPPCCQSGRCVEACPTVSATDSGETEVQDANAEAVPPGSVMCGLDVGPFDAGKDAAGPWRWCPPPNSCVPFNGGWACCSVSSSGGVTVCSAPLADDAGG